MRTLKTSLLCLSVMFAAVSLAGCGKESAPPYSIDLEIWSPFDESDAYRQILGPYQDVNDAHIGDVAFRKKTEETYREDLLAAFAEGNGPDVFLIRNAWLSQFERLIEPVPDAIVTEKEFRDAFVDAAIDDLVVDGRIYGVPMAVDSLALYYNKDLMNAAGIASPPSTWEEFLRDTRLLNRIDYNGNITQSAIAMGTTKNINRSTDILLALAWQQGLRPSRKGLSDDVPFSDAAMKEAVEFYTQFAKTGSPYYSWNSNQHYSIDAFYEGRLAMMINYSWHIDTIRKKNAKLDFGVSPLPQFPGKAPANMSNYWVLVVAKERKPRVAEGRKPTFPEAKYNDLRVRESWQLLRYLALPHPEKKMTLRNFLNPDFSIVVNIGDDPARTYLEKTGQPAARRDLIEEQKVDPWLSPFAYGNLIAKSWRIGEIEKAEGALSDAVESFNRGETTLEQALAAAGSQIRVLRK